MRNERPQLEKTRTNKILESMRILAPGVTHRDKDSALGGIVAGLRAAVTAITARLGAPQDQPVGPISLGLDDDQGLIPFAPPGPIGPEGPAGAAGAAGAAGPQGVTVPLIEYFEESIIPFAPPGAPGAAGANGSNGSNGTNGTNGIDAVSKPLMFESEERETIAFCPPGDRGATGATGAAGAAGASGSSRNICNFRLSLSTGNAVYAPQPAIPSSTDTAAETCTFAAAHGWTDGTIVTPSTTVGGLTTGTRYYLHIVSATAVSFHTTLANAIADASRVNLTANITGTITPSGVTHTTLRFVPYLGSQISLYDGAAWAAMDSAEVNVALGTLTATFPYHVFAENVAGTLTLTLVAWNTATDWLTGLVLQDGIYVKSGDTKKRWVGAIYTDTTTSTIDDFAGIASQVGAKCYISNLYNQVRRHFRVMDTASSWTYASATWRQGNGAAGNKCEFFSCIPFSVRGNLIVGVNGAAASTANASIGVDSITAPYRFASMSNTNGGISSWSFASIECQVALQPGYHYMSWMEAANNGTGNFESTQNLGNAGMTGDLLY